MTGLEDPDDLDPVALRGCALVLAALVTFWLLVLVLVLR